MGAPASAPLLDLETLAKRPTIEVDGVRHELFSADELSVLDSQRFMAWARRLEELQKENPEADEIEQLVDDIARKACVGMPAEIFAKLSGTQKLQVAEVFIGLLLRSRMGTAGAVARAMGNREIGDAFSLASSASTAATRGPGWRERLSRLLGLT